MRTIKEIIGNNEKVWFYIDSPDTWEKFKALAIAEGFSFGSLPQDKWVYGNVVSVKNNGDMGHVPLFAWCMSFAKNVQNCPEKVDFAKYISGCEDFACTESHFKGAVR
ncbi:MAG: hypothetical protein J6L99_03135 [Ruminococcus sp.]|nr:hypothetical protein [Ruminococcus sp.]